MIEVHDFIDLLQKGDIWISNNGSLKRFEFSTDNLIIYYKTLVYHSLTDIPCSNVIDWSYEAPYLDEPTLEIWCE
jgi:hypothetical protein